MGLFVGWIVGALEGCALGLFVGWIGLVEGILLGLDDGALEG